MGNVSSCFLATKGATKGATMLTATKTTKTEAKQLEMWELLKQREMKPTWKSTVFNVSFFVVDLLWHPEF